MGTTRVHRIAISPLLLFWWVTYEQAQSLQRKKAARKASLREGRRDSQEDLPVQGRWNRRRCKTLAPMDLIQRVRKFQSYLLSINLILGNCSNSFVPRALRTTCQRLLKYFLDAPGLLLADWLEMRHGSQPWKNCPPQRLQFCCVS